VVRGGTRRYPVDALRFCCVTHKFSLTQPYRQPGLTSHSFLIVHVYVLGQFLWLLLTFSPRSSLLGLIQQKISHAINQGSPGGSVASDNLSLATDPPSIPTSDSLSKVFGPVDDRTCDGTTTNCAMLPTCPSAPVVLPLIYTNICLFSIQCVN
jgi:hypothetical protein